jgi:hypothetical protein
MRMRRRELRKLLQNAAVLWLPLMTTMAAHAQQYPRVELSAGFSYANANLGSQSSVFAPAGRNFYGGGFAVNVNPTSYLRIVLLDVAVESGHSSFSGEGSLSTAQALFGPQFVLRRRKVNAFADGLFGLAQYQVGLCTVPAAILPGCMAVTPHANIRNNFALGFGGGLDINLSRHFAVRLMQADYLPTLIVGHWEHTYRINTGVVFRFAYTKPR